MNHISTINALCVSYKVVMQWYFHFCWMFPNNIIFFFIALYLLMYQIQLEIPRLRLTGRIDVDSANKAVMKIVHASCVRYQSQVRCYFI